MADVKAKEDDARAKDRAVRKQDYIVCVLGISLVILAMIIS